MSSKFVILGLAVAVFASVGCSGVWVQKEVYDRDVNQLREYNSALERDNAELRTKAGAFDQIKREGDLYSKSNARFDELANNLLKALEGMGVDATQAGFDPSTGAFVMGTDLLFASGSFDLTSKGKDVLAAFAMANKGTPLKIVGHSDTRRVVRTSTKKKLDTDTNLELSVRRATAVAYELLKHGISEKSMFVVGHGSAQPRSGSHKANRRVEIFMMDAGMEEKTSRK